MKKLLTCSLILSLFICHYSYAGFFEDKIAKGLSNKFDIDKTVEGIGTYKEDNIFDKFLNKFGVELPSEKAKRKIIEEGLTPMSEKEWKEYKANKDKNSNSSYSTGNANLDKQWQDTKNDLNTMFDGVSKGLGNPYKVEVNDNGVDTDKFAKNVVEENIKNAANDLESDLISNIPGGDIINNVNDIKKASNKINNVIEEITKDNYKEIFPKGSTITKEQVNELKDLGLYVSKDQEGAQYEIEGYGKTKSGKRAIKLKKIDAISENTISDIQEQNNIEETKSSSKFEEGLNDLDKALDILVTDKEKFNNIMDFTGTSDDKLKLGEDLMSGNYSAILDDMGMGGLSNIPGLEALGAFDNKSNNGSKKGMINYEDAKTSEDLLRIDPDTIPIRDLAKFKSYLDLYLSLGHIDINNPNDEMKKLLQEFESKYPIAYKYFIQEDGNIYEISTDEKRKLLKEFYQLDLEGKQRQQLAEKELQENLITYKFEDIPFEVLIQLWYIDDSRNSVIYSVNDKEIKSPFYMAIKISDLDKLKDNPYDYEFDHITLQENLASDKFKNKEYANLSYYDDVSSVNIQPYDKSVDNNDVIIIQQGCTITIDKRILRNIKELRKYKSTNRNRNVSNTEVKIKDASLYELSRYFKVNRNKYIKASDIQNIPSITSATFYEHFSLDDNTKDTQNINELIKETQEKKTNNEFYRDRNYDIAFKIDAREVSTSDYFKNNLYYYHINFTLERSEDIVDINQSFNFIPEYDKNTGKVIEPIDLKLSTIKLKDANLQQIMASSTDYVDLPFNEFPKLKIYNQFKSDYNKLKKFNEKTISISYERDTDTFNCFVLDSENSKLTSVNDTITYTNAEPLSAEERKFYTDRYKKRTNLIEKYINKKVPTNILEQYFELGGRFMIKMQNKNTHMPIYDMEAYNKVIEGTDEWREKVSGIIYKDHNVYYMK